MSPSHWGRFTSAWVEWLEMHLTQPQEMTQIRWDRQTDRQTDGRTARRGEEVGRHSAESWGKLHMDPPPPPTSCPVSKGLSSTIFRSPASLPNPEREKTTLPTLHFFGFTCIYSLWTDLHVLFKYAPIWIHRVFVQDCVHAFLHACVLNVCVCVCVCARALWTPSAPHEILKGEDGDVRAPGLAGDVSWSSAGLWAVVMVVWPTHSLLPCSTPPHHHHHHRCRHHHPCFPTEQMTFMPETISPPDCRRGVFSRCTARGPNSLKLLPLTNSDFRGFHSWVDTDVLVSAIMGPLSFHANWSKKAELRGWQHGQKENLWTVFKAFLQKEKKIIYIYIYHTHAWKLQLTRIMKVTGPIKLQMKWLSTLSQHLRRGAKRWYSVH